jgi:hypothetical protein
MIEQRWPIPYEPNARRLEHASASLKIATAAASLASKLKGDALGERVDLKGVAESVANLPATFQNNQRVRQLQSMVEMARRIGDSK